jgi:NAD(P)-dependent dehydrogenase (short-subunit alcohol dehydrogenase family)
MNTILITGANRGLGLEMVNQYAQDGWRVLACCRSPSQADKLHCIKEANPQIEVFELDVTDPISINRLTNQIRNVPVDILMNNAGIWGPQNQNFGATHPLTWIGAFKVNTIAPLFLAETLMSQIEKSELKTIANIVSDMASITLNTSGGVYIYRSTKAALNAITKSLAIDLKDKNIKVIALHPGSVKTDMGGSDAKMTPEESVKGIKTFLSQLSMKESGTFMGYNGEKLTW